MEEWEDDIKEQKYVTRIKIKKLEKNENKKKKKKII